MLGLALVSVSTLFVVMMFQLLLQMAYEYLANILHIVLDPKGLHIYGL